MGFVLSSRGALALHSTTLPSARSHGLMSSHSASTPPPALLCSLTFMHEESAMDAGWRKSSVASVVESTHWPGEPSASFSGAQSEASSQLSTKPGERHSLAGLHSPLLVRAVWSTVRQHTSPVVAQNSPS